MVAMIDSLRFDEYRPLLFSIAYRMLGSVMDAEDMVQEAFLRWQQVDQAGVQSPKSYLTAVITRLCIDHLRSAHVQRETYVGPWLPEPLVNDSNPDAADSAVLAESLSMAFLVLLESLTPIERAVFLLHDVFEYDYEEIAGFVGKSATNCRQIARRARQYVTARRPRFTSEPREQARVAARFAQAFRAGDLDGLRALMADEITLWSDGGGRTHAARRPIVGADAVARFLVGLQRKAPSGLGMRMATVNGQPGVIAQLGEQLVGVGLIEVREGRVQALRFVVNPEKLRHVQVCEHI